MNMLVINPIMRAQRVYYYEPKEAACMIKKNAKMPHRSALTWKQSTSPDLYLK